MNIDKLLKEEVSDCISCGLCTRKCDFLKKYNINLAEFTERKDLAYHCFLCGECERVCPKDIDGKKIALMMRENSVANNGDKIAESGYSMLIKEKVNYKFKNYKPAKNKPVLFTGCNFPSFYPVATDKISSMFKAFGIDTVYDCCGKPISELGLKKEAQSIIDGINNELEKREVDEVIMLCPNCYYFLKDRLNVKVVNIYGKLKELNIGKIVDNDVKLFMPCPDKNDKEILNDIEDFIKDGEYKIIKSQCCGLGGCASGKEKEISSGFTKDVVRKAGDNFYVYCASCAGNFRRGGAENVVHILNEILDIDENPEKGIKSVINRMKCIFKR